MFSKEKAIVNEDVVKDTLSYNLKIGGSGGNPGIVGAFKGKHHSEESKEKIRQSALKQITTSQKRKKCSENNWSKRNPEAHKEHVRRINLNRPKSKEQKQKQSEANLGQRLMNNGNDCTCLIKPDYIEKHLKLGWNFGRLKT